MAIQVAGKAMPNKADPNSCAGFSKFARDLGTQTPHIAKVAVTCFSEDLLVVWKPRPGTKVQPIRTQCILSFPESLAVSDIPKRGE